MIEKQPTSSGFNHLGIAPKLLEILGQLRFTTPTPIQIKSIPLSIEGKDMVGIAQTGTGKTMAFGIPMIQRLASHGGRGLVLVPTRELAQQVNEHLRMIGDKLGLRTAVLIGGEGKGGQIKALGRKPHIIIATPGRLIDYLQTKALTLSEVKILVLDEADLMFDMGFIPQINEILKSVPANRQTLLFSATMPPAIASIVVKHMRLPVRIEVAPSGTPAANVVQEMIVINRGDKFKQLEKILASHRGSVLIFARTKHNVRRLAHQLLMNRHLVAEIHSNRSLQQRRKALEGFKRGEFRILVATDIAARGIDVKNIELVLNFDLPDSSQDYVHRIGRTARAGLAGQAITFVSPDEMRAVREIEQIIKQSIPLTKLAEPLPESAGRPRQRGRQPSSFQNRSYHGDYKKRPFQRSGGRRQFSRRRSSR